MSKRKHKQPESSAPRMPNTLGRGRAHLYVTRGATLNYRDLTGCGFETARRQLTEHLLRAIPDPARRGGYLFTIRGDSRRLLRAYVLREDQLMVVTKVEEPRRPLRDSPPVAYTVDRSPQVQT